MGTSDCDEHRGIGMLHTPAICESLPSHRKVRESSFRSRKPAHQSSRKKSQSPEAGISKEYHPMSVVWEGFGWKDTAVARFDVTVMVGTWVGPTERTATPKSAKVSIALRCSMNCCVWVTDARMRHVGLR